MQLLTMQRFITYTWFYRDDNSEAARKGGLNFPRPTGLDGVPELVDGSSYESI